MFKNFWSSPDLQAQPRPQEISSNSSYPPSVISSPSSSHPTTPRASSFNSTRPSEQPSHLSNVSPTEVAGIIAILKYKSVDELRKLLSDKDAYKNLLLSLEPVKTQNRVRDELRNETLQLARENLENEPCIMELRNQIYKRDGTAIHCTANFISFYLCRIIRTTELAAAQEKFRELERKKDEPLKHYSPMSLLHQLQDAMNKIEEESEAVHRCLLDGEIDLSAFVQKYKKMRSTYHKRALTHISARTSATG